jgi:hypothetical protein
MYFPEDLVDPGFVVEEGWVQVPKEVGLGYSVIESRIERHATEEVTVPG